MLDERFDDDLRDAIQGLAPEVDLTFERMEQRATGLRRRAHRRVIGGALVLVLVGIGAAGALSSGSSHRTLNIENNARGHDHTAGPAATQTTLARSHRAPVPGHSATVTPTSAIDGRQKAITPVVSPTTPLTTPGPKNSHTPDITTLATVPVSTPVVSVPPVTSPPATTPAPTYPPIPPGHTRMIVVLDDTGLHAPATFAPGNKIEILFDDRRTNRPYLSYLETHPAYTIWPSWNGTTQTFSTTKFVAGQSLTFTVKDKDGNVLPNISATVTITA